MSTLLNTKGIIKPLKGVGMSQLIGSFDTITANALTVPGLLSDGAISNIIIQNSEIQSTPIGVGGASVGVFSSLTSLGDFTLIGLTLGKNVVWDPIAGTFDISGTLQVTECSFLGNLEICQNYIKATNFNGDVQIIPDGLGTIYLSGPVFNEASHGNFYTKLHDGSLTFDVTGNVLLKTSLGGNTTSSFKSQHYTTINGDFTFTTETGIGVKPINNITNTQGSNLITTSIPHNLLIGDSVNITSGSFINGTYTVFEIPLLNKFTISTGSLLSLDVTSGNINKIPSNDVNLYASRHINIPSNIPIVFASSGSISGNGNSVNVTTPGDLYITVPTSGNIHFPDISNLFIGNTSSSIFHQNSTLNISTSNESIKLSGKSTNIASDNVIISDPIITLAGTPQYANNPTDRGIEYLWYDETSSTQKLGWYGYKKSLNAFTFIPDAINNSEVISGNFGNIVYNSVITNSVTLNTGGNINVNCGDILNVNTLTGCGGYLEILATSGLSLVSSAQISLNASSVLLNTALILFNTTGSLVTLSNGSLSLSGNNNINLNPSGSGVVLQSTKKLILDGTDGTGTVYLTSTTSGSATLNSNNTIFSSSNVFMNSGSTLYLASIGSLSQTGSGSDSGMTLHSINTLSLDGNTININNTVANLSFNTNGNIIIGTAQNFIINTRLVFPSTNGEITTGSIISETQGNLILNGQNNGNLYINNYNNIVLQDSNSLLFGSATNITGNSTGIIIQSSSANTIINDVYNISSGSLGINTNNASISTDTLTISSSTANFNIPNVNFSDSIITINSHNNNLVDSGIITNGKYFGDVTSSTSPGFVYYSNAIETSSGNIIGTLGNAYFNNLQLSGNIGLSTITFNTRSNLNLLCGTLGSVHTIMGCGGLDVISNGDTSITTVNLNVHAQEQVHLETPFVKIPYNSMLYFGNTVTNLIGDTLGNLSVNAQKIIVNGDFQVNGNSTSVSSQSMSILDPIISLGGITGVVVDDLKDRGIQFYWTSNTTSNTGFIGYKHDSQRLTYYLNGTNNSEVFTGVPSDVEFGNAYVSSVDTPFITSINTISGGTVTIKSTLGNIFITPTNGNSVILPYSSMLSYGGNTSVGINGSSNGSLSLYGYNGIHLENNAYAGTIYYGSGIGMTGGTGSITGNTKGLTLSALSSSGNVYVDASQLVLNTSGYLSFVNGGTSNSISLTPDGTGLQLNGYSGVNINSSSTSITGDLTVLGSISSSNIDINLNEYILPLGTTQQLEITSLVNSSTTGILTVTVPTLHNLISGDTFTLKYTNSAPVKNGVFTVGSVPTSTTINFSGGTLISSGSQGLLISNLVTYQGKDVGIQINYWSTTGNTAATSGTINYRNGFLGYKHDTERLVYYHDATISNNVITGGNLGDLQINTLYTNQISGHTLIGGLTGGSFMISGTNFKIGGGNINSTPVGDVNASTGRFTTLTNTVSASIVNARLGNNIYYTPERVTCNSGNPNQSPDSTITTTFLNIVGVTFTATGTMGTTGIQDGQVKLLVCNSLGTNCQYNLAFPSGKLMTPNPNNGANPTRIIFKRTGQSVQLIWDATNGYWLQMNGGVYIT